LENNGKIGKKKIFVAERILHKLCSSCSLPWPLELSVLETTEHLETKEAKAARSGNPLGLGIYRGLVGIDI